MDLQYPVGKFSWNRPADGLQGSAVEHQEWIAAIEETPERLWAAVTGLTDAQLDTPYRPGGWTVRQVVHHLADSHLILYTRIKIALTEDNPPVKTWDEVPWAELLDAKRMPID